MPAKENMTYPLAHTQIRAVSMVGRELNSNGRNQPHNSDLITLPHLEIEGNRLDIYLYPVYFQNRFVVKCAFINLFQLRNSVIPQISVKKVSFLENPWVSKCIRYWGKVTYSLGYLEIPQ